MNVLFNISPKCNHGDVLIAWNPNGKSFATAGANGELQNPFPTNHCKKIFLLREFQANFCTVVQVYIIALYYYKI